MRRRVEAAARPVAEEGLARRARALLEETDAALGRLSAEAQPSGEGLHNVYRWALRAFALAMRRQTRRGAVVATGESDVIVLDDEPVAAEVVGGRAEPVALTERPRVAAADGEEVGSIALEVAGGAVGPVAPAGSTAASRRRGVPAGEGPSVRPGALGP